MRTTLLLALFAVPLLAATPPLPRDSLPTDVDLSRVPGGFTARPAAPADNPLTPAKVRLGRRLFFDPVLSGDRTVACASCHDPAHGFASTARRAVGARGLTGSRNAPTLLNVGYNSAFFWDGRAASLEEQALRPIADPREMASMPEEAVRRLRADPTYVEQFRGAFGGELTAENLARALASFERSLVAGDSPVDRFRAGEVTALSADARQGLWLFESRGGCWRCHANGISPTASSITPASTGSGPGRPRPVRHHPARHGPGASRRRPCGTSLGQPPTCMTGHWRRCQRSCAYYSNGGNPNPNLDPNLKPLHLSDADVRSLVAFLEALTGR